jgi:hypothetical protein
MVAAYNYLVTDLTTGSVLGELPYNNVSLSCQLNTPGNMSGGINLDDTRLTNDQILALTTPGRTATWTYRENAIVWGGINLTREYQSEGKSLSVTGQTFEVYAQRRYPRGVIGTTVLNWKYNMCQTIDNLWRQMQSISYGNIGVAPMNIYPANDIATTLAINGWDLSTSYDDLIQSIIALNSGPDYTITWEEDGNGNPLAQLSCGLPLGNPVGMTDLVVDFPGPVMDYIYNESGSNGNNRWWSVGDGDAAAAVAGEITDYTSLQSGYPLWEGVNNYQGVTDNATIENHAINDLKTFPMPLVTHNIDLKGDVFPEFGSYGMGDYVVCNIQDPRFIAGTQFNVRAVGWSIQPPDESNGTEEITLVLDEPSGDTGS